MSNKLDIIPLLDWGLFTEPRPCVLAGPCSAESEEQVIRTAAGLKAFGINVFRAGIWKPRTHPGSFEGVGVKGLAWLQRVKNELGMKTAVEVAGKEHVVACMAAGVDLVWIGARTTVNPFLMQEIADALKGSDMAVLVKNPLAPDIELWIGAIERLYAAGIRKIGVIHRGFSTSDSAPYRNAPYWQVAIELRRRLPNIPFFCDPSHMAGCRELIPELSQKAMDLGLDGLMIESHCDPSCALSDAKQQLTPDALRQLLYSLSVREADTDEDQLKEKLRLLRAKIDTIDEMLLNILEDRMRISEQIGECKKAGNLSILQTSRWDEVLSKAIREGSRHGLSEKMMREIFSAIHEASIDVQNKIISRN